MFFVRAFVTCMDADLSMHENWSRAQKLHKQATDEPDRNAVAAQLQVSFQAHMDTSAGSKLLSVQMVLLHKATHIFSISTLPFAIKSICNKRAKPRLLFVLSHVTISCCICLT